jgi:hypothetical protein
MNKATVLMIVCGACAVLNETINHNDPFARFVTSVICVVCGGSGFKITYDNLIPKSIKPAAKAATKGLKRIAPPAAKNFALAAIGSLVKKVIPVATKLFKFVSSLRFGI